MSGLTSNNRKGLWAVLWRILIVAPVIWLLGIAWLILVFAALILPPIYAVTTLVSGDYLFGAGAILGWLFVLRFRKRLLQWTFQGFEHTSI